MFFSVTSPKRSIFSLALGVFFGASLAFGLLFLASESIFSIKKFFLAEGQVGGATLPTYNFNRNLSLGNSGEDVRELQRFLNQNEATRVAQSGPGSLLNETSYFGPLTQKAVIRFQELYASEVLTPVGLSRGTGFVGPKTREKLNFLMGSVSNPPISSSSGPVITSISPTTGTDGTQITITGSGFASSTNIVSTGYEVLQNIPSVDGKTITFTLRSNIPEKYKPYHLPLSVPMQVLVGNRQSNQKPFTLVLPSGERYVSDSDRRVYRQRVFKYIEDRGYTIPESIKNQ